MRLSKPAIPIAALLLAALLAFQLLPTFALATRAASASIPSSPSGSASSPTFTPDYMLLGKLKGTTVSQSDRPRSATIPENFQFAATYYGAKDFESAYGATSLFSAGDNGKGETIAIIDAYGDPTIYQDLATFDREFGLPTVDLTVIPVGPYEPSLGLTYGWDVETALDVEAAHTMAPLAHINLVIGANASNALFEAVKLVVTQHLGNVVSMSWGLGENSFGESGFSAAGFLNYPYVEYYFQQGASQGISFFASSGDFGAFDGTTTVTAGYPASSPFVTGVGGTTLFLTPTGGYVSVFNSTSTYSGEQAWSISPQYVGAQVSSGGAYSVLFPEPYYQAGAIASSARASPDVAADANPYTGMVIVLEGGNYVIGGTSLSSPMWAGMAADLDQYVGRNLGPLNPYLYSIYANSTAYGRDFHQVTYGFNGEYQAGPGYNLVTGLGSPNLPLLAADTKAYAQGLAITVSTSAGSSAIAPAQYSYGNTITISATATTPSGSSVLYGTFTAKIETPGKLIATIPLAFSGTAWTGKYKIAPGDPPSSWTITVSGALGAYSGYGLAEVSIGQSLGIIVPIPYPFGPPVAPGVPFIIEVAASTSGGAPIDNATLTAHLIYEGRTISSVPLPFLGGGTYGVITTLASSLPQGSYQLLVDGPKFGSAFEYLYVGEAVTGVMITPNDEAIPSVTPGQQVTFLAKTVTAAGTGLYTSNVTAKIYTLTGTPMASVVLKPAPNKVQFGVFNFFKYQQANYTIPGNLTQGFYKLQFLSSYRADSTSGAQLGNFTTGFYVSGPTLSYTLTTPTTVFEGQYVTAHAKIIDAAGMPVTSGVFLATFIPSGYAYEAYVTDFLGYTSVPMVYSTALGEWETTFQIPSVLTSPNAFGNRLSSSAGPWTVYVSGESAAASNAITSSSYVNVLPYTYYSLGLLNRANIGSAPLVSVNGTGYLLTSIGADALTIRGLTITLTGVSIGSLTIVDSRVSLDGSQVGSVTVTNSTLSLTHGTRVGKINPPLPTITVAGLSKPLTGDSGFTVTVAGELLTNRSLVATVDGSPITLTATLSSSGLTAKGTVNVASLPDGVHILTLTATQSDGLSSTSTAYFSINTEGAVISTLVDLTYVLTAVAAAALVIALLALRKRRLWPGQV